MTTPLKINALMSIVKAINKKETKKNFIQEVKEVSSPFKLTNIGINIANNKNIPVYLKYVFTIVDLCLKSI
jgi:hypothetical protein